MDQLLSVMYCGDLMNDSMIGPLTRRFLQARRRGLFADDELTRLLHRDAEYTEVIGGQRLTVVGADTIGQILVDRWSDRGDDGQMSIIRRVDVDDRTAMGHWCRQDGDGLVHGRDTYTVDGGLITHIEVEEFDAATIPAPLARHHPTTPVAGTA